MAITTYQANRLADFLFGRASFTPVSTYYIGLSTTAISPSGVGASEPQTGNYARIAMANDKNQFTVAANGLVQNVVQLEFPESTTPWGTITTVFIADSSTVGGGNILYYDTLQLPRTVQTSSILLFAPGAFRIQIS